MKFFLNLVPNFVRHCFVSQPPPPLGRWAVAKCSDIALLDSERASEDHCGDVICGLPKPQKYRKSVKMMKCLLNKKRKNGRGFCSSSL